MGQRLPTRSTGPTRFIGVPSRTAPRVTGATAARRRASRCNWRGNQPIGNTRWRSLYRRWRSGTRPSTRVVPNAMDSFILCLLSFGKHELIPRTPISTRSRSTNTRRRELAAIRGRVSWRGYVRVGSQGDLDDRSRISLLHPRDRTSQSPSRLSATGTTRDSCAAKKAADLSATFVVRTSASHLAITDRIDTPYNTKGRSMHPDRNSHPVRGSNNSRGHGRGRRPLFHRSPYQQLLRVRDRHPNHPNRPATPELVMVSPRQ
jgi:hypothetical protein